MATLGRSSDHYASRFAQPSHNAESWHETYKANKYNHVDQTSDAPGLILIRPMRYFWDTIDYHNYTLIRESAWHDGESPNELSDMTKMTVL